MRHGDAGSGGQNAGSGGELAGGTGGAIGGQGGEAGRGDIHNIASCAEAVGTTGVYVIDPDGEGGEDPLPTRCDMDTDGGGWTLALIKNSVHDGVYSAFGSGNVAVEVLSTSPESASSNSAGTPAVAGWLDLNEFPFAELRIAGYAAGVRVYHTSLGIGWDFGTTSANAGLTVCGDGSNLMTSAPASGFTNYPTPGAAQAISVG